MLLNRQLDDMADLLRRLKKVPTRTIFNILRGSPKGQPINSTFDILVSAPIINSTLCLPNEHDREKPSINDFSADPQNQPIAANHVSNKSKGVISIEDLGHSNVRKSKDQAQMTSLGQMKEFHSDDNENVVGVSHLKNFLTKQEIVFLEEDFLLVFRCFGSNENFLSFLQFKKMLDSNVWDI